MKRSDAPNPAAVDAIPPGDAILLDAKGREVLLECHPDGEILFWSDDGAYLEFDRKHTALILAALRRQDKLPKSSTEHAVRTPLRLPPQPAPGAARKDQTARMDAREHLEANRKVAKEKAGWGATVLVGARTLRYYYDKRDQAREADGAHRVGEAGRVA